MISSQGTGSRYASPSRSPQRPYRESRLHQLFNRLDSFQDDGVDDLVHGFAAFFCILAAYFLLLPLRDEAGVALGTSLLPSLFTLSFMLTFIATPATTIFLSRASVSRDQAVQQLFRVLALTMAGFFVGYCLLSPGPSSGRALPSDDRLDASSDRKLRRELMTDASHMTDVRRGDLTLTPAQHGIRVAFFLYISMFNIIALSTMWARMADVFTSDAATRCYGLLGAGATAGQLAGSVGSAAWTHLLRWHGTLGAGVWMQALPMLVSALLLEAAGRMAFRLRRISSPVKPSKADAHEGADTVAGSPQGTLAARFTQLLSGSLARTWEGFRLIAASPYLLHLCAYLVATTSISSFLYFEKALIVSSAAGDAASRMALFANINSMSACAIVVLQVCATSWLLRRLGLAGALAVSPAFAGLSMLGIAAAPVPTIVGLTEVVRKTVTYTLARPAREVLFTVTSREEKYKAKICIDTLVLRAGDMLGAAFFRFWDASFVLGPSGLALSAFPLCVACSGIAYSLGLRQQALAERLQGRVLASRSPDRHSVQGTD